MLIQNIIIYIVLKYTIYLMRVKNFKVKEEMNTGKFDMKYTDFSLIFAKYKLKYVFWNIFLDI